MALIVSMSDLARLYPEGMKDLPRAATSAKRQQAWTRFSALLDEMQEGNAQFSAEEVEAGVLKAVEDVRRNKHKK